MHKAKHNVTTRMDITFFSYSHDDLDIKRSIMSIKNLIGKKADKIQINYQFY